MVAQQSLHALPHLLGGFVGEGDREDVPRRHAFFGDQVGDAMSDDARLAGAGAGENQQRAFGCLDGFALLFVEGRQEISHYVDVTI